MMIRQHRQRGFTLVEMAIVLTIIGLMIGGILKGQQLLQNARVTATIAQVNATEAATTSFRDIYNALPGDMPAADTRIPNCANCGLVAAPTVGDGVVGDPAWTVVAPQATLNISAPGTATVADETILYWAELAQAGLLSGITNAGITSSAQVSFGTSLPVTRLGGGWLVGNSNGSQAQAGIRPAGAGVLSMTGTILMLTPNATTPATNTPGQQVMTPTVAAQLDRKMDDGVPNTGFVQPYGVDTAPSCFAAPAPPPQLYTYDEAWNSKDCGLVFRIQG